MSDLTLIQRAGVRPAVRSTGRVIAQRAMQQGAASWHLAPIARCSRRSARRQLSAADGVRARENRDGPGGEDGQRSACQVERGSGPGLVAAAGRAGSSPSGCGNSGAHVAVVMLTGAPDVCGQLYIGARG
jgi:hypothetical protein